MSQHLPWLMMSWVWHHVGTKWPDKCQNGNKETQIMSGKMFQDKCLQSWKKLWASLISPWWSYENCVPSILPWCYYKWNGTIDETISQRCQNATGIIKKISSMLSSISLGSFHYDIALVLRDAKFTNSIPTNSEVWYNMQQKHTDSLEKSDLASELPYC